MPTQAGASDELSSSLEYFHCCTDVFFRSFPGPVRLSPGVSEQKGVQVFSCESGADFSLKGLLFNKSARVHERGVGDPNLIVCVM